MKKLRSFIALLTFVAFSGLVALEATHHHNVLQPDPSASHCVVCQVVGHAHALPNATASLVSIDLVSLLQNPVVPHPYLQFVFKSHGLSPPVL